MRPHHGRGNTEAHRPESIKSGQSDGQISTKEPHDIKKQGAMTAMTDSIMNRTLGSDLEQWRTRVKSRIEACASNPERPEFKTDELVLMSLLMADRPLSVRDIAAWTIHTFNYYARAAAECLFGDKYEAETFGRFEEDLRATIASCELPITRDEETDTQYAGHFAVNSFTAAVLLGVAHGDQQLRRLTEKPLRFFDLPPEIRDKIYAHVFDYPKTGLVPTRSFGYYDSTYFEACSDAQVPSADPWLDGSVTLRRRYELRHSDIRTWTAKDILSCLGTSRQFCNEAASVFYGATRFHFPTFREITIMLPLLHVERRKLISNVSLKWGGMGDCPTKAGLEALASLPNLKTLTLQIDEATWVSNFRETGKKKYASMSQMPGLRALRKIRGLKFVDFQLCPSITLEYKAGMLQEKRVAKNNKAGDKRKRGQEYPEMPGARRSKRHNTPTG